MLCCVSGVAYGTPSELEGLSQTVFGLVFDLALSGDIVGRARVLQPDQQEDRQSHPVQEGRWRHRRRGRPADIVKGYQVEKNVYVTVEDEELEALQIDSSHTIEIDKFVPLDGHRRAVLRRPYYIVPNDEVGQDAFAVIRDAMKSKKMVGLGRVVIAKRERPIILRPLDKGLEGITLRYPYEVRKEDEYFGDIPDVKVSADMLKLAEHIVESKAAEFRSLGIGRSL